jgi:hypothetical protein
VQRRSASLGHTLLIVTAIALYFAKWPILILAAIVGLFKMWLWLWLCRRYPRTMYYVAAFLSGFVRGLLGRRR